MPIQLNDITIRNELKSGDLEYVIHRHLVIYQKEYNFGSVFEQYVAKGLLEFEETYNQDRDRVWICEHQDTIIGFLLLMHRSGDTAQLRYFYLEAEYRNLGLGKKLMQHFMDFLILKGFRHAYLWTTHELGAAASLYKRYGFGLTQEKSSNAFGKSLTEQRYDLSIEPA